MVKHRPCRIPQPGVPQIMTMEGKFVRAAYNNEGYVILGYQLVNRSIGEEWMLLEVGMTVLDKTPGLHPDSGMRCRSRRPMARRFRCRRSRSTGEGDTRALEARERVQRDSINYFPPMASQACRIGFFSDLELYARCRADQVGELSNQRAPAWGCLYFRIPWGHHLRPALAQRQVPEEPHPGVPFPDPSPTTKRS